MTRVSILCVCIVIAAPAHAGDPAAQKAAVKKLATELGEATLKGDHATVIDLTYETIVKELGGREKAIEATDKIMNSLKAQGITFRSFEPAEPGEFYKEGANTFVLVPTTAVLNVPQGRMIAKSYLLGISADAGKTWKFLDGAGLSKKEERDKVLPKLPAKLKLPEKQPPQIIKNN